MSNEENEKCVGRIRTVMIILSFAHFAAGSSMASSV